MLNYERVKGIYSPTGFKPKNTKAKYAKQQRKANPRATTINKVLRVISMYKEICRQSLIKKTELSKNALDRALIFLVKEKTIIGKDVGVSGAGIVRTYSINKNN